jgi:hypothetical protein
MVAIGLVAMVMLALTFPAAGAIAAPTRPIAQARQQPDGTEVTLAGWVTVASGTFSSALMDQGFALADPSGGLYVSVHEDLALRRGAGVTLSGTVGDDGHGQRILTLHQWQATAIAPSQAAPPTLSVAAAQRHPGEVVTVAGVISRSLQADAPYGDRLWLRDAQGDEVQIYLACSTHIQPQTLPFLTVGEAVQVTGLSSQYDGRAEIMPRDRADLHPSPAAA